MNQEDISNKLYRNYYFTETPFKSLMRKRIHKVLLVCSSYDAFMLEEDGRIDEQIFNEYVSLNLRYPPQFIQATSARKAFSILEEGDIELVISMLSIRGMDTFDLAKEIKVRHKDVPIVVLTPFSREVSLRLAKEDTSAIDHVFCWLGHTDLLLAIIKLIEDKMNAEYDVNHVGVQSILLVEDSIRFYSSYLPNMYKIIFNQSKKFMQEGLNEHEKTQRMRGRPKILLATNYEEAQEIYKKYKENILGVISDGRYKKDGVVDKYAGIKFCEMVKKDNKYMPVLLQSSEDDYEELTRKIKIKFVRKQSKTLLHELRNFINQYLAFGDFVFIEPKTGREITRASNLKELQEKILQIPENCLEYHLDRNHFSKWLTARALFPIADLLKYLITSDFRSIDHVRRFLFDTIASFRINKGRGIIAKFYREKFDEYLTFTRIGEDSIGGKARGLAFLDSLIKKNWLELDQYNNINISIPKTVVLSTDIFDEFMEQNKLYSLALSDITDEEILQAFVNSRLPYRIHGDLCKFISVVSNPVAIRSSSLLEDSHYQPFAGIYSTYMIPKSDAGVMLEMLTTSIKSVYASVFFQDSKAYMTATKNVIDEEKMAIVLQEVCGQAYGSRFYPTISGVARSVNFYPIAPEKAEDGIVNMGMGLGKHIVEGGITLRFSPKYPKKILQLSNPAMTLRETQKSFFALDLDPRSFKPSTDDAVNLLKLPITEAEKDGSLKHISSTYDFTTNEVKDGTFYKGKKLITFSNILKYSSIPLAEILQKVLRIGHKAMNNPIEIEFAVNINPIKKEAVNFYLLQIRPIVDNKETLTVRLDNIPEEDTIISSNSALGNGIIDTIFDVVYVKTDNFNPAKNQEIAYHIDKINAQFLKENKNYVLIGPGRWGSSDSWLGIPVRWSQISAARVIIESGLSNYRIEPSQGTHFFQNLTSFSVAYLTINPYMKDGFYDTDFLNKQPAIFEDEYIRHVRFSSPISVKIDGQKSIGIIMKPGVED